MYFTHIIFLVVQFTVILLFFIIYSKIRNKRKEKYKNMYTVEEFDQQKTKVLKYILYKKRTEQEVRKKFSGIIEENILEDVIAYLKQARYINDHEYIEKTIHNFMALKNLSMKEIQCKLIAKGLSKNEIEDYLYENQEELEQYEIKSAENILYKKSVSMEKEEIKQYLLKKGYRIENINKAMES